MWSLMKAILIPIAGCAAGALVSAIAAAFFLGDHAPPGAGFMLVFITGTGAIIGAISATLWSCRKGRARTKGHARDG
jgi:hypothetical protein